MGILLYKARCGCSFCKWAARNGNDLITKLYSVILFYLYSNIYVYLIKKFSLIQFQGTMKLSRLAKSLASDVNVKRRAKGLLPRPVLFFPFFILSESMQSVNLVPRVLCLLSRSVKYQSLNFSP